MAYPVVGNARANLVIQSSIYEPPNLKSIYSMSNGNVQMDDEYIKLHLKKEVSTF
jgi:hypothetical protein